MKHLFSQNKVRLLILLVCIIVLWQVMRNWPEANNIEVSTKYF